MLALIKVRYLTGLDRRSPSPCMKVTTGRLVNPSTLRLPKIPT